MQQRLSIITLGVSDLRIAKQFYDKLGWEAADKDNNNIVAYNLQSMALVLYEREHLEKDANVTMKHNGHSNFTIAHNLNSREDVDKTLLEAKKAGATIIKPAQEAFWGGYSGYFADPDHFLWEVAFNPFSMLDSNGEFQWKTV